MKSTSAPLSDEKSLLAQLSMHLIRWTQLGARIFKSRVFLWALAPSLLIVSLVGLSAGSPPAIPAVALSADPLYAVNAIDKPALALALSVEYPTVGAQYTASSSSSSDSTYSNANEYLGYYDAESCYTYNDAPSETPGTGQTSSDYKRFDRSGAAASRMCTNAFSGNFLNWASNSAIDMLRLALSGGDRYIDTSTLTILQRAVIPNGDPICMWNSTNFPAKQLQKDGGGTGKYWGAVPTAMITAASGSDIWVANTLNRIYFRSGSGTAGSCSDTTGYTLGGATTNIGPIADYSGSKPSGMNSACAAENATCSFTGIKEVWYGANNNWKVAPASNGVSCSNGVFGDPISGTVKNCYYRTYSGSWTPSSGTLNSDGFFYARVQVCNVSSGALQDVRDYGLCKLYPGGNYKPSGVIQKYSDQLRLAAFGYLMDPTASYNNGRYGGVLRAPMKYVGSKTYDYNGLDNTPSGGNANAEWNANTGVFYSNPDGDTSQTPNISGVINYLNKFGRTGSVAGRYKTYDPVGELHYEVLRYLQGLQPSTDAISSITTSMYDGFPVYTNWTDPYGGGRSNTSDYSCVRSNIVVIGDINTHDGNRLPSASAANNIPDISSWRSIVQSFEKNQSVSYTDGAGASRTTGNPNGANNSVPSATTGSQIMGSAYWARTHDIRGTGWTNATSKQRPGLRVKTFLFDVNEYGAQNDTNTRRYSNQFFMAAKYGGFETDPSNPGAKPYNTWGNPFKAQSSATDFIGTSNNNVWQNPNSPGEAAAYYLQSSARGVLNAFDDIFSRASTKARSIAGVAVQSQVISSGSGSLIYQGAFDTSDWSGDVLAIPLTVNASNTLVVGSSQWSASDRLTAMASPASNRNIVMGKPGATASPTAVNFTWATVGSAVQTDLNRASPSDAADGLGQDRLNYLRGDKSKEGNPFRVRTKLLGDIVNSSIVYSGSPTTSINGANYSSFVSTYGSRTPAVFVGANDGMMHAFNANTGDELFAYIPSWMSSKLSALTSSTYNASGNHQAYVDAPPVLGTAQVGNAGTAADWKTVLVSGTGAGGAGVFALDVTNPSAFTASNVMWEFTRADDTDIGNVIGQPQILKFRTAGTSTYRWFAVVASGVNNYVTDSAGLFSATGKPALFLLALDKAAGAAWTLGTNYYKINLPINATLSATKPTGLVNFTALTGSANEVQQVFMGDLNGYVWKLDFTSVDAANWSMENLSPFYNLVRSSPLPLYIAKDGSGNNQPITTAPKIFNGPRLSGKDTFYVVVGTGKYLEVSDKTSTAQNSIYSLFDNGTSSTSTVTSADNNPASSIIYGRSRLQAGSVNTSTFVITVPSFAWGRPALDTDTSQRAGWYFDLPTSGERLISAFLGIGYTATFNTIIPGTSSAGTCSTNTGSGNSYIVDITLGTGKYIPSTVGLLGPSIYLRSSTSTTTISDNAGKRKVTTTYYGVGSGQSGLSVPGSSGDVSSPGNQGRLSWRQINNYLDLKVQ